MSQKLISLAPNIGDYGPPDSRPTRVEQVAEMRKDGKSYREIADAFGISQSTVGAIEPDLPGDATFTGYSGYVTHFESAPSDYDEIYVYADSGEMERRFAPRPEEEPNLFVLNSDEHLENLASGGVVPLLQLYVDLWQLGRPANRFVKELEKKMEERAIRGLKKVAGE